MRPRGTPALIVSPNSFKVAAIILLSKGPQAKVLELHTTLVPHEDQKHLEEKHSNGQRIYLRDIAPAKVVSEHPAQVVQTGLARTVCERLERGNTEPINAANVDNAGGVFGRRGLFQEWCDKLGQVKDPVEVEGEDSREGLGGVFIVGSAPVRAGVVDEDVEL
jgi:hypothetical protein